MPKPAAHLVILGDRDGLSWVLRHRHVAFPVTRRREAMKVGVDDRLLLYTTRGCFHNPTRDRGRIIGEARTVTPMADLPAPVELAGRAFAVGCEIELLSLAPYGAGVELAPLAESLRVFPAPHAWRISLRRSLLTLPDGDARLLSKALARVAGQPEENLESYLVVATPPSLR